MSENTNVTVPLGSVAIRTSSWRHTDDGHTPVGFGRGRKAVLRESAASSHLVSTVMRPTCPLRRQDGRSLYPNTERTAYKTTPSSCSDWARARLFEEVLSAKWLMMQSSRRMSFKTREHKAFDAADGGRRLG